MVVRKGGFFTLFFFFLLSIIILKETFVVNTKIFVQNLIRLSKLFLKQDFPSRANGVFDHKFL